MDENKGFEAADVLRGVYGGIFGGICCLLPLLALATGLAFIPGIMIIPRYRLYFILISLAAVIFFTWRRLSKSKLQSSQKFSIIVITLMSFFGVLALFTYAITPAVSALIAKNAQYHTSLHEKQGSAAANNKPSKPAAWRQVTLKVTGLTCPSCKETIERLVSAVNGVKKANVDAYTGEGKVIYDANLTTKEAIVKAIEGQGMETPYKAEVVKDEKI